MQKYFSNIAGNIKYMIVISPEIEKEALTGNVLKNYRRKQMILDLLYHNDTLSASEIGAQIDVSLPTSLSLLKDLCDDALVEEKGTGLSKKRGRRPAVFGLKGDSIFVVACELGHYTGKIGVYDVQNQLVSPVLHFETSIDDELLVDKIWDCYSQIIQKSPIDENRIFGVGLSMPGLVNVEQGKNYTIKRPELQNVADRLRAKFNKMILVNNDGRMQGYGEFIFGAAAGHENALVLNWGWGLGVGIIIDGKIYNGATGYAGEMSHTKFVENGELCTCGKNGCLETVISSHIIAIQAARAVKEGHASQLAANFKGNEDRIQIEDVIQAANNGDELCISILNTAGRALGKALANTIQLLNPGIIVLGGIVSTANQHVLTPMQQSIEKHCLVDVSDTVHLVVSDIWEQSGLLGTTAMLFQKLFCDI